jgi:hypothetical protein
MTCTTLVIGMQLSVKNVDEDTFREFKAQAVKSGLKIGGALTLAMQEWLEKSEKKPKRSLLDLKPWDWGPGTERLSEEADDILYGKWQS